MTIILLRRSRPSIFQKLLLDLLPLHGLLLQDVQVVAPHTVHDKESHTHVPGHEHHPIHPDLSTDSSGLHLGLVILCESLACVKLFDGGHRAARGEVTLLDGLPFEVFLLGLFLWREEERSVEAGEDPTDRFGHLLHLQITINIIGSLII